MSEIKTSFLKNGEREYKYLSLGNGKKLIFFFHGFPDDAGSMKELMQIFSKKDFTCIAPFMRGYSPGSSVPFSGTVSIAELAGDLKFIVESLKSVYNPETTIVLGHDWGAIASYAFSNLSPGMIDTLVAISVPPIPTYLKNLLVYPSQIVRSWYILFFQIRAGIPEAALLKNDLLRRLWEDWSPGWKIPEERFREVFENLKVHENLITALGYYRGLLTPGNLALWNSSRELVFHKISVPTLILAGEKDECISTSVYKGLELEFYSRVSFQVIDKAGHFLHLEAPERVAKEIFRFIKL
ncbi:alpha/beta fold hydrolase [Leptospira interrogans]|uniref:Alpha/beta hydrolase family protein n=4 Tax=Leptospira interrogans TaxID=173 RepID=A0A0E2DMI5_LEPIR|nr:alpha/beta hydrolase [Leptospira interrogans]EKR56864.1 alpha/beta hydrolase family protein [Leptospira interrogans str. UI 12758]UML86209.1 alpha/beta hydrolase [Leptospira interrogans]